MPSERMRSVEELREIAQALDGVSDALRGYRKLTVDVVGLTIRGPRAAGDDILVVVKGLDADGKKVVAFHNGTHLPGTLMALAARLDNGSLRWRDDEFVSKG